MRTSLLSPNAMLDLYSDFLICSFSYTTATSMSAMLPGQISHDRVTRFLSSKDYGNKEFWQFVKPTLRQVETEDGCLIVDDTVEEKLYTDENDIIAWHFDHTVGRSVKGMNIVNCVYTNGTDTIPLSFEIVKKTEKYIDEKTGKTKRRSTVTKNELFLGMFDQAIQNAVKFSYVLADIWFGSADNMEHIHTAGKHFIMPLKENRLVALSLEEKLQGHFQSVSSLSPEPDQTLTVFLKGLDFPVQLAKQVFTNKDGSTGVLYLVTDDLTLGYSDITTIYHKRWKVEEFHKSVKSNTGLAKSPTQTVRTQSNHFFASIYANFKLEGLKMKRKKNHFALKAELYTQAMQSAFSELRRIQAVAG
jgi:hypothetical protein